MLGGFLRCPIVPLKGRIGKYRKTNQINNFRYIFEKASIFQKACFLEIKEYALNTSLKKRVFSIEIVKIDLGMFFAYVFDHCCHISSLFYMIYKNIDIFWNLDINLSIYRFIDSYIDISIYRFIDISTYRYIDISMYRYIEISIHR